MLLFTVHKPCICNNIYIDIDIGIVIRSGIDADSDNHIDDGGEIGIGSGTDLGIDIVIHNDIYLDIED